MAPPHDPGNRMRALPLLLVLCFATAAEAQTTLTLADAREILRENAWSVRIAREDIPSAETLTDTARAVLLPSITATGSYTLRDEEIAFDAGAAFQGLAPWLDTVATGFPEAGLPPAAEAFGGGGASVVQPRHDVRGSLTFTQTLFNARAFPLLDQAHITIDRAQNGVDVAAWQLEDALLDAWFAATNLQQYIAITERNLALAQVNHERANAAFEEGVGTLFEVNRTRIDVASAERDVANANANYRIAVSTIASLLDRDDDFDTVPPGEVTLPADLDGSLDAAMSERPDLTELDLAIDYEEERIREVRSQFLPVVIGEFAMNLQRETAFAGDRFFWTASIFAEWNLYDGGQRAAERRRREATLVQAELRREQTEAQLRDELDRMQLELQTAEADLALATEQVELADRNVWLTSEAFDAGAATQVDVELARQQLYLSELALADAEVRWQQAAWAIAWRVGLR